MQIPGNCDVLFCFYLKKNNKLYKSVNHFSNGSCRALFFCDIVHIMCNTNLK